MKPQKIFPFLLAVGLFLLVLGLLLLFRYAQARGSMMVLAFVFVGAGCTVLGNLLGNLLGKWVSRQAEAHFWKNTFHHPPE
ncbi:MAG: hypothetical protein ACLTZE_01840 [Evtepia sp.]